MANFQPEHDHNHDHEHGHDHEHEHEHHHHHGGEDEEKDLVMAFIEALIEERLSENARRAVFGILSLDPAVRDAAT